MSGFAQARSGGGCRALDRLIQRKATRKVPVPQAVVVQSKMTCELLQHEGPPLPLNLRRVATVRTLRPVIRPPAIFGGVRSVRIDPIKAQARRCRSHVSDEVLKAIPPAIAHRDTTSPVVLIARILTVVASGLRMLPCVVLLGPRHAMRPAPLAGDLTPQAPTTPSLAVGKAFARYLPLFPARAVTHPIELWPATAVRAAAKYGQTAKCTARKIGGFHTRNITWFMYATRAH